MDFLAPENIALTVGALAVVFSVYNYFKNPQEQIEKKQAVSQKEVDGKANLLAQQVQWEKEANEKKFIEFGVRLDSTMTLAQNHIHSVSVQVDALSTVVNNLNLNIMRLQTIIDERIPSRS